MPDPTLKEITEDVRRALAEDVGNGDVSAALISPEALAMARLVSREEGVLCGTAWFDQVFRVLDDSVSITWYAYDSESIAPDQTLCRLAGPSRALLTGERTALNFLQTLSGTATLSRRYADAVQGTGVIVLDTRKTLPGLRKAQKYAVACGGCRNHRCGLYDGILIKENHLRAAHSLSETGSLSEEGSFVALLERARALTPPDSLVEIEVRNLAELRAALKAGARRVLLDNFTRPELRAAVEETGGRAALEASGGITLETIRAIAETGVDFISVGGLTKDVKAIDLSLLFDDKG